MNCKRIMLAILMMPAFFGTSANDTISLEEEIQVLETQIAEEQKKYDALQAQAERMVLEDPFSQETDIIIDIFARQLVKLEGMKNKLYRLRQEAAQI